MSALVGITGCDEVDDDWGLDLVPADADADADAAAALPLQQPPAAGTQASPLVTQVRGLIASNGITPLELPPGATPELVALGESLFYDKILSGNMDTSCSTCHHPRLGTTDQVTMNRGVHGVGIGPERVGAAVGGRTTQPLWNLHKLSKGLGVDSKVFAELGIVLPLGLPLIPPTWQLQAFDPNMRVAAGQAMMPQVTDQEMLGFPGENELTTNCVAPPPNVPPALYILCAWSGYMARLAAIPEYVDMFEEAYPGTPFAHMNFAHVGNAIAAYQMQVFYSNDSPWDRFVGRIDPLTHAQIPGDDAALTDAQLRGARRFLSPQQGNCTSCHRGNGFTDEKWHKTAAPQFGPGGTVPGGDGPGGLDDYGRQRISKSLFDRYAWRTPPLRNVMLTGPWGRQSHYNDIRAFLRHYRDPAGALLDYDISEFVDEVEMHSQFLENRQAILAQGLDPRLATVNVGGEAQIDDLVAFLHALTDAGAADFPGLVPTSVPSGLPVDP